MRIIQPQIGAAAFNCPFCEVYAKQNWKEVSEKSNSYSSEENKELKISRCTQCGKYIVWYDYQIIYPNIISVEQPNEDLNEEIKKIYLEAANIVIKSPAGAAGLLRLAIQKLIMQLGKKGKNLNEDIAELVKEGLPVKIQQSLDIVRVTGNESLHLGEININDNKEIALKLFELVNIIAQHMITHSKQINSIYNKLPKNKLEGIKSRDKVV